MKKWVKTLVLDVIKLDVCILGNFHQEAINAAGVIRRGSHLGELEILFLNERICNAMHIQNKSV